MACCVAVVNVAAAAYPKPTNIASVLDKYSDVLKAINPTKLLTVLDIPVNSDVTSVTPLVVKLKV